MDQMITTKVKTTYSTTIAASVMLATSTVTLFLTWGMMAVMIFNQVTLKIAVAGDPCSQRSDCKLRIDSKDDFDRMVHHSFTRTNYVESREQYRGDLTLAIVPNPFEIESYCVQNPSCLRHPVFTTIKTEESTALLQLLKTVYPESFGSVTQTQWNSWLNFQNTPVYYLVYVHRIAQGNGDEYGFFLHNFMYPPLPDKNLVAEIFTSLRNVFTIGTLYYYPVINPSEYLITAQEWKNDDPDLTFPIYFSNWWGREILDEAHLNYLTGGSQFLNFLIPKRRDDDGNGIDNNTQFCASITADCPNTPMLASEELSGAHFNMVYAGFPEMFWEIFGPDTGHFNELFLDNGAWYLGNIQKITTDSTEKFYSFWFRNYSTAQEFVDVYRELRNIFKVGKLFWKPIHDTEEFIREVQQLEPDLVMVDLLAEFNPDAITFETYNPGEAYGRVRILTPEELAAQDQAGLLSFQDLIVLTEEVLRLDTPVAGTITGKPQVSDLSHLSLLAQRRGTINAFIRDIEGVFRPYEGQLVHFTTDFNDYSINPADLNSAQAWWSSIRPRIRPPLEIDRNYRGFDSISAVDGSHEDWFRRFGGKASGLAKLYEFLPSEHQVIGFSIPFSFCHDFMNTSLIQDKTIQERPLVTFHAYWKKLLQYEPFLANTLERRQLLQDFQKEGNDVSIAGNYFDENNISRNFIRQIRERIKELWDSDNRGYDINTGLPIVVRFRSSSNQEDGVEFNGAGLYDSTSVCLPDELDTDTSGPSLCDATNQKERTISRGFKKVCMSIFNNRAYEEREYYQLPQETVEMAILVNTQSEEVINGVALTGIVSQLQTDSLITYYTIDSQVGETSVVDPPPGVLSQIDLVQVNRSHGQILEIKRVRNSNLISAPQTSVMIPGQISQLAGVMAVIDNNFPLNLGPYPRERVLLDMEFKFMPEGNLVIKQVRPFLKGAAERFNPIPALPLPSKNLVIVSIVPEYVQLRWDDYSNNEDKFIIQRAGNNHLFQDLISVETNVTNFRDTNIQAGTLYIYRIVAENETGRSEPTNEMTVVTHEPQFLRGDANADGQVNITDPIFLLANLFQSGSNPPCDDAADANDDGVLDVSDAIKMLLYMFGNVTELPAPGGVTAGPDPTADALICEVSQ